MLPWLPAQSQIHNLHASYQNHSRTRDTCGVERWPRCGHSEHSCGTASHFGCRLSLEAVSCRRECVTLRLRSWQARSGARFMNVRTAGRPAVLGSARSIQYSMSRLTIGIPSPVWEKHRRRIENYRYVTRYRKFLHVRFFTRMVLLT